MTKRIFALFLSLCLLLATPVSVFACDESQSNTYITQILFGDESGKYGSSEQVKMLQNALYLCSEQSNGSGQNYLDYLKSKRVSGVPKLDDINLRSNSLLACSHNRWEYVFQNQPKIQENRKKILRNTVNKVFDFGVVDNLFGSESGKCNSFAALLYYLHILTDYVADDPINTATNVKGKEIPSYSGQLYVQVSGNRPSFTSEQRTSVEPFTYYSGLDSLGRAGMVFANIGPETLAGVGDRDKQTMRQIRTTGYNYKTYDGFVNSKPPVIFNRCHLLAHQLGGADEEKNLVTGTRYMNADEKEGMVYFENIVADYIKSTNNHVLYRATPIFKGDNLLCSGIQLEAYSVEDGGKEICFNVYIYNVQPGVSLSYATGENDLSDNLTGSKVVLPFAVFQADEQKPDLMYEIDKHLKILFDDQLESDAYNDLDDDLKQIRNEARSVSFHSGNEAQRYVELKKWQYKYIEVLKKHLPKLLSNEKFFKSAFK